MTSGGARVRSGPAPEFDALKRDRDGKEWTKLPTECSRPTPEWPAVVPDPTVAELAMWAELWAMPQAHVWYADRVILQVALYTRMFVEAAEPHASSQKRLMTRQLGDQLLLSIPALHSSRYVITGSPEADLLDGIASGRRQATGTDGGGASRRGRPAGGQSTRARMQVVPPVPEDPEPEPGDEE